MVIKEFILNKDTLVFIQYNETFKHYEALTASIDPKTKKKIQKLGNDWNCFADSAKECENKITSLIND